MLTRMSLHAWHFNWQQTQARSSGKERVTTALCSKRIDQNIFVQEKYAQRS
jgi:hypothetical protein